MARVKNLRTNTLQTKTLHWCRKNLVILDEYLNIPSNVDAVTIQVISDNLERSGLFLPIDKKAFIQNEKSLADQPRFEDWKIIKAQHLISGKVTKSNEKIAVEFRLFDVTVSDVVKLPDTLKSFSLSPTPSYNVLSVSRTCNKC